MVMKFGAAASKIIVFDSFDRADATSLGTADTGQTWTIPFDGVGIKDNQAYMPTINWNCMAYIDAGVADGIKLSMTLDVIHGAAECSILVKYQDASNYNFVQLAYGNIYIKKKVANTVTTVDTTAHTLVAGQKLSVVVDGTTYSTYIDGVQKSSATVSELASNTKSGIYMATGAGTADPRLNDFTIEYV